MINSNLISVVTPCYNEEENIELLYNEVKEVFDDLRGYDYEHIFIDNDSRSPPKYFSQPDNLQSLVF